MKYSSSLNRLVPIKISIKNVFKYFQIASVFVQTCRVILLQHESIVLSSLLF